MFSEEDVVEEEAKKADGSMMRQVTEVNINESIFDDRNQFQNGSMLTIEKGQSMGITDEKLEIKLRNSVKSLINRKFFEYKKNMMTDPACLKNTIKMLSEGNFKLTKDEKEKQDKFMQGSSLNEMVSSIKHKGRVVFAIAHTKLQTSKLLMRTNIESWRKFMDNSDQWMGNFTVPKHLALISQANPIAISSFKTNMLRVQQVRSYNLHVVQKDDIWDTKNWFRNEVSRIISEHNMQVRTLEELEFVV